MTTVGRVYNFSSGPAVLPVPVLEEIQRDLLALPGGRHVDPRDQPSLGGVRGDPRPGRGRRPHPRRRAGELQGAVPAGRRQHAVLDGADEPADARRAPPTTSTPARGREKAIKEAKKVGTVNVAASTKARELRARAAAGRAAAHRRRRLRPHHLEQHHRRHRVQDAARRRRRAARQRHLVGHVQPSARRRQARADLRRARRRTSGPSGVTLVIIREDMLAPLAEVAADDDELCGAGGERLDVQHAADLRGLHARPGDEVADRRRAASPRSRRSTSARPPSSTPRSIAPASTAAPRTRTAAR